MCVCLDTKLCAVAHGPISLKFTCLGMHPAVHTEAYRAFKSLRFNILHVGRQMFPVTVKDRYKSEERWISSFQLPKSLGFLLGEVAFVSVIRSCLLLTIT